MKATYQNPEVVFLPASFSDILTLSVGTASSDGDLVNFSFDRFNWI